MAEMTTMMLTSAGSSTHSGGHNQTECIIRVHSPMEGAIYIINQLICLFGLSGNGIVLCFLTFNMQKNPFIIYIFNLALADFGYLLCCLFVIVVFTAEYFGSYHFPLCTLMFTFFKMELFLYSTGLYFLTAISTERCLCAVLPIWYRSYCPSWGSAFISAVLWSFAIVLSGLNIFSEYQNMTRAINIINLSIFTPLMILSSLTLFIKVRYCLRQRCAGHLSTVILLTVLCFLIFAIPLSIQLILREFGYKLPKVFYLLASVNSSINPVIYFLVGSHKGNRFREPLHYILYRALNGEQNPREGRKRSSKHSYRQGALVRLQMGSGDGQNYDESQCTIVVKVSDQDLGNPGSSPHLP